LRETLAEHADALEQGVTGVPAAKLVGQDALLPARCPSRPTGAGSRGTRWLRLRAPAMGRASSASTARGGGHRRLVRDGGRSRATPAGAGVGWRRGAPIVWMRSRARSAAAAGTRWRSPAMWPARPTSTPSSSPPARATAASTCW
jgi:hypothetical protein